MNTNFLQAALVQLITGQIVASGTAGDKAKQSARATEIVSIVNALNKINSGDTVTGLTALQTALQTTTLSPAESMAFQSFMSWLSVQLTLLGQVPGATILGDLQTALLKDIGDTVIATCQKYIEAPTPAA
ncbi:MAG TPA: hypothetical protein VET48_04825 [Steroidobacteraceae bacterium]|nr:hypothetical protein [Steroidobacteraceae bacterium]